MKDHKRRKYAFVKIRTHHAAVAQIIRILKHSFPEFELDVVDIKKLLRVRVHIVLANLYFVARYYGIRTFLEEKSVIYNRFFGTPFLFLRLKKILNRCFDRNSYAFTIQDCSLFDGSLEGTPHFVYTDHTVLANRHYKYFDAKKDLLARGWIDLERRMYQNATMVFTRSENIRESLVNDYTCDPTKVVAIYFAPYPDLQADTGGDEKYGTKNVLFVGMEWERKGGPQLMEAFKRVLEEIPDARLTIVGCRPDVRTANVTVVGRISAEEVVSYYRRCAVFCLPTRREPFGIAFLEAMRFRLPVIGTRTGAVGEFVVDNTNGYLVEVDDVTALAQRLVFLLKHPDACQHMGAAGFEILRDRYSLHGVSQKLRKNVGQYVDLSPLTSAVGAGDAVASR